MKPCLILLLATVSILSSAQDTLDLPLKRIVKTIRQNCHNSTAADVCKTRIFSTDSSGLFYKINYDVSGRIHSKGAVVKAEMEAATKRKPEYFEVGTWRYYNYEANEIVYYTCIYSGNPGCSVLSKEELKKEKIQ